MEFVKNDVVPLATVPGCPPRICAWVDRLARTVDIVGLKPGCRIGNQTTIRQREPVADARPKSSDKGFEKSTRCGGHADRAAALDRELHPRLAWRPKTKAESAFLERRTVSPCQRAISFFGKPDPNRTACQPVSATAVPLGVQKGPKRRRGRERLGFLAGRYAAISSSLRMRRTRSRSANMR